MANFTEKRPLNQLILFWYFHIFSILWRNDWPPANDDMGKNSPGTDKFCRVPHASFAEDFFDVARIHLLPGLRPQANKIRAYDQFGANEATAHTRRI